MLLTCPSCNARYEAPDAAFPPEGRVVECSACGARWLQPGPDQAAARETPDETDGADAERPRIPGLTEAARALDALRADRDDDDAAGQDGDGAKDEDGAEDGDGTAGDDAAPAALHGARDDDEDAPAPPGPGLRTASSADAPGDAPRDEAEGDAEDDRAPAGKNLLGEDLTDDDLIDEDRAGRAAEKDAPAAAARAASPGSGLLRPPRPGLPDANRLNADLRAEGLVDAPEGGGGFWLGMLLAVIVCGGLIGVYIARDRIVEIVPEAGPALASYARSVDEARLAVETGAAAAMEVGTGLVEDALSAIDGALELTPPPAEDDEVPAPAPAPAAPGAGG